RIDSPDVTPRRIILITAHQNRRPIAGQRRILDLEGAGCQIALGRIEMEPAISLPRKYDCARCGPEELITGIEPTKYAANPLLRSPHHVALTSRRISHDDRPRPPTAPGPEHFGPRHRRQSCECDRFAVGRPDGKLVYVETGRQIPERLGA